MILAIYRPREITSIGSGRLSQLPVHSRMPDGTVTRGAGGFKACGVPPRVDINPRTLLPRNPVDIGTNPVAETNYRDPRHLRTRVFAGLDRGTAILRTSK